MVSYRLTFLASFSLLIVRMKRLTYGVYCTCMYYAEQNRKTHNLYGTAEALIIRGQSQAKRRVVLFLTVFVITGFFSKCCLMVSC